MRIYETLTKRLFDFAAEGETKGITFIKSDAEQKLVPYRKLYEKALFVLYNLQQRGLKLGDELVFQVKDSDNELFIYTFWACILGGIIPVPISVVQNENRLKIFKVWRQLNNPKILVNDKILENIQKFAAENTLEEDFEAIKGNVVFIDEIMEEIKSGTVQKREPDDIAFIQFSSGSTGDPKGVMLTHKNLLTNAGDMIDGVRLTEADATLSWMPLTHDMGIIGFHLVPLILNINQYIMPTTTFISHPILWMKKVNEHRATILSSPNFGYRYFLDHMKDRVFDWDLGCVRKIFNGAEPISIDLIEEFLGRMSRYKLKRDTMYTVYGMAEASLAVAFPPADKEYSYVYVKRDSLIIGLKVAELDESNAEGTGVKFADEGYSVKHGRMRIVDENGDPLDENTLGLIQIGGGNVTKGYYNNAAATRKTITPDGWLNTGDLGFIKNNRIIVTGRYKDIIFVNGSNFYPHDLEAMCEKTAGIDTGKVVVCGVYDEEKQKENIIVYILFKKKIEEFLSTATAIKAAVIQGAGIYPDAVIPIKAIPKTTSGKVQRYKLAQMYKDGEFDELLEKMAEISKVQFENRIIESPANEIEERLAEVCRQIFAIDRVGIKDKFIEYGANSLLLTRLHTEIESLYPGRVKLSDIFSYPTIEALAEHIKASDAVHLKEVTLTEKYFNTKNIKVSDNPIRVVIEDEIYKELRKIAEGEGVEAFDILLAAFIHMLSQISGSSQIGIQASNCSEGRVSPVDIDLDLINDFEELINAAREEQAKNSGSYYINKLDRVFLNRSQNTIAPLFISKKAADRASAKLTELYDLVLILSEEAGTMEMILEYDGRRLLKNTVNYLMDAYLQLIELLTSPS